MALLNICNFMTPQEYFNRMTPTVKKQYDALREFFHYGVKAEEVASKYGYTRQSFYWMVHTFKARLETGAVDPFFKPRTMGRMPKERNSDVEQFMLDLRKSNYSCNDIVVMGQSHGYDLSTTMFTSSYRVRDLLPYTVAAERKRLPWKILSSRLTVASSWKIGANSSTRATLAFFAFYL
jgi:hypothetical protein